MMRILLAVAALATISLPFSAATVRQWSASTGEEFARGTLERAAIDPAGGVSIAPARETLWGPDQGIVWALSSDGLGGAFVALSGPGRLIHVDAQGEVTERYVAEEEALITAVVADGSGGAWIGLSPGGRLLHLDAAGETLAELETESTFVWSLAREASGTLWVGTGLPGRLIRHEPDSDGVVVLESDDDPVRCLALLPDSGVVFGTGGQARVGRASSDGEIFMLFDADEVEIVDVSVDADGTVYALAARGPKQVGNGGRARSNGVPSSATTVRVVAHPSESAGSEAADEPPPRNSAPQSLTSTRGGTLYRIAADGAVRTLWTTESEMPFALALLDETLVVATGDRGRLHQVDRSGRSSALSRIPANQASALAVLPSGALLVGGSTDARLEKLTRAADGDASFLSEAIDAGGMAAWGMLRWDTDRPRGTGISLSARSGNTSEPDSTWSAWNEVSGSEEGSLAALTHSRWAQIKVELSSHGGQSPRLRRLELIFRPHNREPRLTEFEVEQPGVVFVRGPANSSSRLGPIVADDRIARRAKKSARGGRVGAPLRRAYEAGARTFRWAAADPDDDRLLYDLELRRDDSADWFRLASGVDDEFFSWDARGMPDGDYRARVTVRDSPDNPSGSQASDRRTSRSFTIDNRRPTVESFEVETDGDGYSVTLVAADPGGVIAVVEFAVDGVTWYSLDPVDGVADSGRERYRFDLPAGGSGARPGVVMVRVTDRSGNLGGDLWVAEKGD